MRKTLSFIFCLLITGTALAQHGKLHTIKTKNAKQLHRFFAYKKNGLPIISGHRGGMEMGFPENSIEAFENTLKYTPAFYEIDPRLTKDSVIVLMHDATLNRTTNGKGKVSDYTLAELKQLRLKDKDGNITDFRIPTLAEAIEWARGRTILNLDKKDVPLEMTAEIIRKHHAEAFVMVTVHNAEQAQFYYRQNPNQMFSAFIKTPDALKAYEEAGIPYKQMIAYIGPDVKPSNQELYQLLHGKGIRCMISSAPTYDKLKDKPERAEAYRTIVRDGADIIESDLPIETAEAIKGLRTR